jgi:maltose O-acetyltransferase
LGFRGKAGRHRATVATLRKIGEAFLRADAGPDGPALNVESESQRARTACSPSREARILHVGSMASEREKMLRGELYDPLDAELSAQRLRARMLLQAFNQIPEDRASERLASLRQLIALIGEGVTIQPPFYCDYGSNISLGEHVFMNFNCVILDAARVTIGSHVLFGPAVQVYAATHPTSAAQRRTGLELGRPVEIGDDVWVGGGAIICPGVRVGARTVIGAGSVVTRDIPSDVLAAGNPCRPVRTLGDRTT